MKIKNTQIFLSKTIRMKISNTLDLTKKRIVWITADSFIDVDLPILPIISKQYNIKWFVIISKNNSIDYSELIKYRIDEREIEISIVNLKNRIRSPFLAIEFLSLIQRIRKLQADLYYINFTGLPYFMPFWKLKVGAKKTVIAAHNVSTPEGAANQKIADVYNHFVLNAFQNFHVFSKNQLHVLSKKKKNKNILYAPLALKDFGVAQKEKQQLITFLNFGIISEYKRVDVLIEAANKVYEKTNIKFKVIIAGYCKNWSKYSSMIKYPFLFNLKIERIPNEEIPDLFSQSHYFVLPYQDIAQSGALTVAFNYNLPVLASKLKAFEEFIIDKRTGYLFDVASADSLARLMEYLLLNHKDIYSRLQKNQKEFVDTNYSNYSIVEKYISYFNDIM